MDMRLFLALLLVVMLSGFGCDFGKAKRLGGTEPGASAEQPKEPERVVDVERDTQQIKECFENYKAGTQANDGQKVLQCVDQNTRDYYSKVLDWALTAKREEVEELPLMDRLAVLSARLVVPAEKLRTMTGGDLLAFTVDKGMISGQRANELSPGTVTFDGNSAKMGIVHNGRELEMGFDFHWENGGWKIDLTSAFPAAKFAIEFALRRSQMSENDLIFESFKEIPSEKPPTEELWNPIGR